MAHTDEEERRIRPHPLVIRQRHLDLLKAGRVPALAEDRQRLHLKRFRDALDPLVDLAEKRLVASDSLFSLAHRQAILSPAVV